MQECTIAVLLSSARGVMHNQQTIFSGKYGILPSSVCRAHDDHQPDQLHKVLNCIFAVMY